MLNVIIPSALMQNVNMLSVSGYCHPKSRRAECCYAECHKAECYHVKYRSAECFTAECDFVNCL